MLLSRGYGLHLSANHAAASPLDPFCAATRAYLSDFGVISINLLGDIYRLLRHLGIVCAVCPNLKHSRGAKLDWKRADVLSKNNCCAKVKVGQALFLP